MGIIYGKHHTTNKRWTVAATTGANQALGKYNSNTGIIYQHPSEFAYSTDENRRTILEKISNIYGDISFKAFFDAPEVKNYYITGGSFCTMYSNLMEGHDVVKNLNDIDIFILGQNSTLTEDILTERFNFKLDDRHVGKNYPESFKVYNKIVPVNGIACVFQVIRTVAKDRYELISSFDIDITKSYYSPSEGLKTTVDIMDSIERKEFRYLQIHGTEKHKKRAKKYEDKGFTEIP